MLSKWKNEIISWYPFVTKICLLPFLNKNSKDYSLEDFREHLRL